MRELPEIRLLALDVDGTLAVRGHEVSPATRDALHAVTDAGIVLVIATGRRYRTTRAVIDALDLPLSAVCLGGALVKQHDHLTLHRETFEPALHLALVDLIRRAGQTVIVQQDADIFGHRDVVVDDALPWNERTRAYHENAQPWAHPGDAAAEDHALAFSLWGSHDDMAALESHVREAFPLRCATVRVPDPDGGDDSYLEILPAKVDKWTGLTRLALHLDVPSHAICAVGDAANDLPMIRQAAWGVAMGNAGSDVQAAADWVTGRHDEDGIVAVVERILGR